MNKFLFTYRITKLAKMIGADIKHPKKEELDILTIYPFSVYSKSIFQRNWACVCDTCFYAFWKYLWIEISDDKVIGESLGKLCYMLGEKYKQDAKALFSKAMDRMELYDSMEPDGCISELTNIITEEYYENKLITYNPNSPILLVGFTEQAKIQLAVVAYVKGLSTTFRNHINGWK